MSYSRLRIETEAFYLAKAAMIVRREILQVKNTFKVAHNSF